MTPDETIDRAEDIIHGVIRNVLPKVATALQLIADGKIDPKQAAITAEELRRLTVMLKRVDNVRAELRRATEEASTQTKH